MYWVDDTCNLLEETITALFENGRTSGDVHTIEVGGHEYSWDEFEDVAASTDYDPGFGETEINRTLKLYGNGWILIRNGYDGSEWWEFHSTRPAAHCGDRPSLAEAITGPGGLDRHEIGSCYQTPIAAT